MRNSRTLPGDAVATEVGDAGFIGVNSRVDPSMLEPGYVSEAINCRFRNGVAETRKGYMRLPWMNKIPKALGTVTRAGATATFTATFPHGFTDQDSAIISGFNDANYNGTKTVTVTGASTFTYAVGGAPPTPDPNTGFAVVNKVQPWGTVYGIGDFKDPNTLTNYTIIAAGGYVYFVCENNSAWQLALPSGVTITDTVTFTQCYDTLIMFRGASLPPLAMPTVSIGFQTINKTLVGDGAESIPNSTRGLFFQNRLFIPKDNDEIAFSDFGDYTRYLPVVQELKVNTGSSDSLVNLAKFNDTTVVAFKENSIYALSNIYGNLGAAVQDQITDQFGLVAAESVAHCGADLLFLSQMGVMSLRQTEQNKIQSVTLPLSDPIQPIIDRINWNYARNAAGAYWDSKYYLAVPLDEGNVFGPELVSGAYPPSSVDVVVGGLTAGATYRWTQGTTETSLTNGSQTLTTTGDFTAQGVTITLTGPGLQQTALSSVKRIYKGVNNAILVYDFLNQAWAGYDNSDGLTVKRFHIRGKNNTDRLFVVTVDGFVLLYEEDYEDTLLTPYTDVTVSTAPSVGNTVNVNASGTITVTGAAGNTNTTWGVTSLAVARENLWYDGLTAGYYRGGPSVWGASNTAPAKITNGVRFYATNGALPAVVTTGTWATITQVATQSVRTTITTRGFAPQDGVDLSDFNWLTFDMQTWNPNYSVTVITDGVKEESTISSSITKSRTNYTVFGRPAFTATNVNGDHATDQREDYSVTIGSGSAYPAGIVFDSGVDLTRHQEFREEFKLRNRGRAARVKFASSQGRIRLMGCKLESTKKQTRAGAKS